jgi:3-oxoacyl-[acyl-carrier-protein] synthase-1
MSVYIKEAVVKCALGLNEDEILCSINNPPNYTNVTFDFGSGKSNKPYAKTADFSATDYDKLHNILHHAILELIVKSSLTSEELKQCGLYMGSTSIDVSCTEVAYKESGELPSIGYTKLANMLAERLGIGGDVIMFTSACTSSANALLHAKRVISDRIMDRVIVVGFEFYNEFSISGFSTLGILSDTACRSFDKNRDGIVLGDGVGAMLLEKNPNSEYNFELLGGANRCDISSSTSHNIDGNMVATTIQDAILDAKVSASQITLIKAHGTGSQSNDTAEGNGIKLVFKELPKVLALKPLIGHTLGGCGAIELGVLYMTLKNGFIPKTQCFITPENDGLTPTTKKYEEKKSGVALLNHFGFGGNGCVIACKYGNDNE